MTLLSETTRIEWSRSTASSEAFALIDPHCGTNSVASMLASTRDWEACRQRLEQVCADNSPAEYDEDPPTDIACQQARRLLEALTERPNWPEPEIYADGDGGIVFKHQVRDTLLELRIQDDGELRLVQFSGGKLVENSIVS